MRRQSAEGLHASGVPVHAANPDPYDLPARVGNLPGGLTAEISREQVVLRGAGLPGGGLVVPTGLYAGVSMSIASDARDGRIEARITLEHEEASLGVPLFAADDTLDIVARWQSWAKQLRLPLLVRDNDDCLCLPVPHVGKVRIGRARPRRLDARILRRRPLMLVKRRPWGSPPQGLVAGHELIARH